jgi:ubiquinone biosynthesis protein
MRFDIIKESQRFADSEVTAKLTPATLKDTATSELLELVPLLRRLSRRFERITAAVEHGQFSANVRLLADPRDRAVLSGYLHQAMVCVLAAATGLMAVILLASQGGPLIEHGVRLYAVFGYNLLVISAILAIRVLFVGSSAVPDDPLAGILRAAGLSIRDNSLKSGDCGQRRILILLAAPVRCALRY